MPRESLIMFVVAAVLGLAGLWLLLQLRSPQGPVRAHVYRLAGIMMVAGGIVLGFSAYAMWQWSAQP